MGGCGASVLRAAPVADQDRGSRASGTTVIEACSSCRAGWSRAVGQCEGAHAQAGQNNLENQFDWAYSEGVNSGEASGDGAQ